jgi:xylulokinase
MAVFVGCDLGTMGTKAAVVDESGAILGSAYEEAPLHRPAAGRVEQDLDEIEASAYATIGRALAESGRARDVAAVSFSGQMSGIGTVGADHRPVTHYDSWLDTRCEPYIVAMSEHADRVTRLSGCPPTYSHGPKILWWKHERPDDWKRIARFVVPGAYVAGRVCGLSGEDAFVDRTYLHFTNLADTERARWSAELLDLFELDEAVLPRIVEPTDVVGEVTRDASEASGLPVGTPVAAGAGDQAAAALGAGVVEPGQAFDSAGTASVFAICVDGFHPDLANKAFMAMHSVLPGTYIALAFVNGGGLALRWFRDEVVPAMRGDAQAYERLCDGAERVPVGSDGLLWFPHLQGRVLPPQPHARGAWVGLTSGHTLDHMFRAVLEGIAYEYAEWARLVRQAGADAEPREARVLGGGAASPLWNQIKADVLGIDWTPTLRQECGVLGNAVIAAMASGHLDDWSAAVEWQETREPIHPSPDRHRRYQSMLDAYRELGTALAPVHERLAAR